MERHNKICMPQVWWPCTIELLHSEEVIWSDISVDLYMRRWVSNYGYLLTVRDVRIFYYLIMMMACVSSTYARCLLTLLWLVVVFGRTGCFSMAEHCQSCRWVPVAASCSQISPIWHGLYKDTVIFACAWFICRDKFTSKVITHPIFLWVNLCVYLWNTSPIMSYEGAIKKVHSGIL